MELQLAKCIITPIGTCAICESDLPSVYMVCAQCSAYYQTWRKLCDCEELVVDTTCHVCDPPKD